MRVAFRVNGSPRAGLGHVMRCRNLAADLRERGADVTFLAEDPTGNVGTLLKGEGYQFVPLPSDADEPTDAANVTHALASGGNTVVLDH